MPRRRSFLERLIDGALEAGSQLLGEIADALEPLTGPSEPQEPPETPPPRTARPRRGRVGRLEQQIAELTALITAQQEEISTLRREQAFQRRREQAIERREAIESGQIVLYPHVMRDALGEPLGRLTSDQWIARNRRLQSNDLELVVAKYNELRRAGLDESLLAVVETSEGTYALYVGESP